MKSRRLVALLAALLFLASLAFPYWTAKMRAPTYPEHDLAMHMYAYKYDGDIDEWNRVGRLVGVRVPPPIPPQFFQFFPAAVVAMSLLALTAAVKERLLTVAAFSPWALMLGVGAWGQYSLYLFGHNLDPDRPLRFLQPFTPPIVGVITMGKIQTFHYPDISTILFTLGALLLTVAAWRTGQLRSGISRKDLAT